MADIILVVAVAKNGVIGASGDMPWRLSTDLKRFKAITMGKVMLMGRKTFESIGKALPGRTTIVVTRDQEWQAEGVVPANSVDQGLLLAQEIGTAQGSSEICVVGGGEIYRQTMDRADRLHVTHVDAEPEGDTVFPEIDEAIWSVESCEDFPVGEKDSAATRYCIYNRVR